MSKTDDITKEVSDIGKLLSKTTQATPIKEIGDRKCAAFQQLVNVLAEKKEMMQCKTVPAPMVKNSIPESALRFSPYFNPIISTPPELTSPLDESQQMESGKNKESEPPPKKGQKFTP